MATDQEHHGNSSIVLINADSNGSAINSNGEDKKVKVIRPMYFYLCWCSLQQVEVSMQVVVIVYKCQKRKCICQTFLIHFMLFHAYHIIIVNEYNTVLLYGTKNENVFESLSHLNRLEFKLFNIYNFFSVSGDITPTSLASMLKS